MVLGWRRAFCTSIPKDKDRDLPIIKDKSASASASTPSPSPRIGSRFGGFFSNPSTPRPDSETPNLRCRTTAELPNAAAATLSSKSTPQSPRLQCKTRNSPRLGLFHRSAPSSPRSPSAFSLLKSGLRLSKGRCGICLHSVKTGQGTAIFTAECGHSFHFPCISAHVKKQVSLACPICNFSWKEMHLLVADDHNKPFGGGGDAIPRENDKRCVLKVYNDDEPLSSPTSGARFNPIPESDETEEEYDEFPGFFATNSVIPAGELKAKNMDVAMLPEAAVVSVGRTSETYAVVLKVKAPAAPVRGISIDLVIVVNVSRSLIAEKLQLLRRMMRVVVSSLTAADRLSIVAFSTSSKRLLPLRRMTTSGRRSARRIIDAIVPLDGGATSATDALMKAAKVIEDRREKNPASSILLFSDGHRGGPMVSSTRFSHYEIPLHSVNLSACLKSPPADDTFAELLNVAVQDLKIQLGFTSGSAPAEISAVYSYAGRASFVGSGSSWCRVGDLHSQESRELLIELRVPSSLGGAHRRLTVRCTYKDPSTQKTICDKERPISVPRPRAVGSSATRDIQRLRCLFVTTRAVAESRRMADNSDVDGAHHMLASARAMVLQSASGSSEEFVRGLEAELAELNWKRQNGMLPRRRSSRGREAARAEDKAAAAAEPLTPTSAWRAAERLAKVAIMRKSLNRVSDLHGFEDARF
ncbi:E3 ubiquitin-protein ligase WAV3-like [Andrographis paniculata]|uniref:E3 ubiquitin-protein ligase WAV3-like n=1 Tax=Andrographis paniculata TaxID=175694 RepID=UPI0021E7FC2B|nr:E3 ubiquitin-protein ligase WAV3-like [Andrographis paniculata]